MWEFMYQYTKEFLGSNSEVTDKIGSNSAVTDKITAFSRKLPQICHTHQNCTLYNIFARDKPTLLPLRFGCCGIFSFPEYSLWKFVAENHTENFAALKITLKNSIKEGFTENYTEKKPLLFRNAKNQLTYHIFIQTKYHFKS